jgi:uridine kinase
MPGRRVVLSQLADLIAALDGPARVAVDGADAAGKTTLADELVPLLESRGRHAARVSIDDFLRPRVERYGRGDESPVGYYLDSFDHDALRRRVSEAGGDPVVVDGVFLLRPELRDLWDFSVLVEVGFDELLRRGVERDGEAMRHRYLVRYLPAQRRYFDEVEPARLADAVLENTDPEAPSLRLLG